MIRKAALILINALVVVLLIDPSDTIFHLKVPLFVLVLLLWVLDKLVTRSVFLSKDSVVAVLVILLLTVLGIAAAIMQHNFDNPAFAFGFLKSTLILFLVFVIEDYDIPIDKILIRTSIILPFLTFYIFYVFITDPVYFNKVIFPFFNSETATAFFSSRKYYGFDVSMFFFKTSPLLIFPLAYHTYSTLHSRRKLLHMLLLVLFLFAMLLSGTRANILAAVLVIAILFVHKTLTLRSKIPFISFVVVSALMISLFITTADFSNSDISQQVKSAHVNSYIDLFEKHPMIMLFGQGLGSEFFSEGFNAFVPQTELTYFDIVRIFGAPLAMIYLFVLLYPLIFLVPKIKTSSTALHVALAYVAYLFIAGTNPLLISSTGMLAILSVLAAKSRLMKDTHPSQPPIAFEGLF